MKYFEVTGRKLTTFVVAESISDVPKILAKHGVESGALHIKRISAIQGKGSKVFILDTEEYHLYVLGEDLQSICSGYEHLVEVRETGVVPLQ